MLRQKFLAIQARLNSTHEIFEAGFMAGQAEKVFTGVCQACMFGNQNLEAAQAIAKVYGLHYVRLKDEIWLCTDASLSLVMKLREMSPESESYHVARGLLCGIPNIDPNFRPALDSGEPTGSPPA